MLTDVVLPLLTGPELARRVAEIHPGVKVLYMSGYTDAAIAHDQPHVPAAAFLQKPFTVDALLRRVREVLDG